MPTRRVQRGPATGGPPPGFQNSPSFNELYVDGATDAVAVGTGISGAAWSNLVREGTPIRPTVGPPIVFSALPAGVEGMLAVITDASVNTWGTVIAGGGANRVLGYYNGAAWTVVGK